LTANLLAHIQLVDTGPDQLRDVGQRLRRRAVQLFSWDRAGRDNRDPRY